MLFIVLIDSEFFIFSINKLWFIHMFSTAGRAIMFW